MKSARDLMALSALALLGCANPSSEPSTASTLDSDDPAVLVPTEAEADAAAAQSIDESNADAEFQKLLDEIENDG